MISTFPGAMKFLPRWFFQLLSVLLFTAIHASPTFFRDKNALKSATFQSPAFILGPGEVQNKFYYDIDFPKGHISLKDFNAEVVDEGGNSIPLYETYLHHWLIMRYYISSSVDAEQDSWHQEDHLSQFIVARNSGSCQRNVLGQYYGLGSETRQTSTYIPDPYGIEVGNPEELPDGYMEKWLLNVHAIDTRGVVDRMGCTECRCDLYNVTINEFGLPLPKNYTGGLACCYDQTQCRVREGFKDVKRTLYLRYTVRWVDWDDSIIPVRIYIFDITDSRNRTYLPDENARHGCQIEYEVKSCGLEMEDNGGCIDTRKTNLVLTHGGDVIYGVSHQHSGGIGAALYGQDGRTSCASMPIYGEGKEVGNEDGYIVGMSSCYPKPGSVKIGGGEVLMMESNYSSTQMHAGVMGLFYLLVADPQPRNMQHTLVHESLKLSNYWALIVIGVLLAAVVGFGYWRRNDNDLGYESLVM